MRYKILFKSQYGFQKGRSTTQATLDFLKTIESALEDDAIAVGAFCDLSKAFDTLDHKILIEKLDHYGIRGKWLNWLVSYLNKANRHKSRAPSIQRRTDRPTNRQTDRPTDQPTDRVAYRVACTRLKNL